MLFWISQPKSGSIPVEYWVLGTRTWPKLGGNLGQTWPLLMEDWPILLRVVLLSEMVQVNQAHLMSAWCSRIAVIEQFVLKALAATAGMV